MNVAIRDAHVLVRRLPRMYRAVLVLNRMHSYEA